jgi:alpha-galactosidase
MINEKNHYFLLSTTATSLLLHVNDAKKVTSEYYGGRIKNLDEAPSLTKKYNNPSGSAVNYGEDHPNLSLDLINGDYSTSGRGDFGFPSLILKNSKGSIFDFSYESCEIKKPTEIKLFPTPHGATEELVITCLDEKMSVTLRLHYLVFEKDDVIGRYLEIANNGPDVLDIAKASSLQLILPNRDYETLTLYGSWANENNVAIEPVRHGRFINESLSGSSSNRHNPFFLIKEKGQGLAGGLAYGFNLVYSGNHEESVELDAFGNVRLQIGISSYLLKKELINSETFVTPLALMTFSSKGAIGVSHAFSAFVNDCVIPLAWKGKSRPIVYNNWEATSFDFNEAKIKRLMKKAAGLGIEMFVLDDGWFGKRNDDSHGLGDWQTNTKKIPGGLKSLSAFAKKNQLRFGIWMEPEMVNAQSELFKKHPEWIVTDGLHAPLQGRHQFTLDLRKAEVQDFVYQAVGNVLKSADIAYLKWDCNRPMSDFPAEEGAFVYDYMVGLYRVLGKITAEFPHVLFENCASGGNRFDLGMLSFFPQNWMSDDTDCHQRLAIQGGASWGYPLSVMSNHVSAKTNNQMLRLASLDAKFDVAAFGVLGYELDLNDLTPLDEKIIKEQIKFYKEHREALQFGEFTLLRESRKGNYEEWQTSLKDEAIIGQFEQLQTPNPAEGKLVGAGFQDGESYSYETRKEFLSLRKFGHLINFISPIHIKEEGYLQTLLAKRKGFESEATEGLASGAVLNTVGVSLTQEWAGTGLGEGTRVLGDFGGRLYFIKKV